MMKTLLKPFAPMLAAISSGVFKLAPQMHAPLHPHIGKVCHLAFPKLSLYLEVTSSGWRLVNTCEASLKIIATPSQLIRLMISGESGAHALMKYQIKVLGDTGFLQACQQSIKTRPDWQHTMSLLCSDLVADTVLRAFEHAKTYAKTTASHRAQDFADYAIYESQSFVGREAFEDFKMQLDDLLHDLQHIKFKTPIKESNIR